MEPLHCNLQHKGNSQSNFSSLYFKDQSYTSVLPVEELKLQERLNQALRCCRWWRPVYENIELLCNTVELQDMGLKKKKSRLSTANSSISSCQSLNHWCTLWNPQDAHWQEPGHDGGSIILHIHCSCIPQSSCSGWAGCQLQLWPDLVWHLGSLSVPRKSSSIESRWL